MDEYEKQADEFLKKTNTKIKKKYIGHKPYFADDKESRDVYEITLTRGNRSYTFTFGQSLSNSGVALYKRTGERCAKFPNFIPPKELFEEYLSVVEGGNKKKISKVYQKLAFWFKRTHFPLSGLVMKIHPPTPYEVLASLETHAPEDFKDFCAEFGYSEDSRTAYKIYKAVVEQTENLQRLYNEEELRELGEIV